MFLIRSSTLQQGLISDEVLEEIPSPKTDGDDPQGEDECLEDEDNDEEVQEEDEGGEEEDVGEGVEEDRVQLRVWGPSPCMYGIEPMSVATRGG